MIILIVTLMVHTNCEARSTAMATPDESIETTWTEVKDVIEDPADRSDLMYYGTPFESLNGCRVCIKHPRVSDQLIKLALSNPWRAASVVAGAFARVLDRPDQRLLILRHAHLLLMALNRVDYQWSVQPNPKYLTSNSFADHAQIVFTDPDVERHGFKALGQWAERRLADGRGDRAPGTPPSETAPVRRPGLVSADEHVWTLAKWLHRRGEVAGHVLGREIAVLLRARPNDAYATWIADDQLPKYSRTYQAFQSRWAKQVFATSPYDRLVGLNDSSGQALNLPTRADAWALRSGRAALPDLPAASETSKTMHPLRGGSFVGLIDRLEVRGNLMVSGPRLSGSYGYGSPTKAPPLRLEGRVNGEKFRLDEYAGARATGRFEGTSTNKGLMIGEWPNVKDGNRLPFVLEPRE